MDWDSKIRILIWIHVFVLQRIFFVYLLYVAYRTHYVGDIAQEPLHGSQAHDGEKSAENVEPLDGFAVANNTKNDVVSITSLSGSAKKKKASSTGKRKRVDPCHIDIKSMMVTILEDTKTALGDLAEKLTQPPPPQTDLDSSMRTSLFQAIVEIPDLSLDDQIIATHHLAHNKADMYAFWGMNKEEQARFVRLLLSGALRSD